MVFGFVGLERQECDYNGDCQCKYNYGGPNCEFCKDGYYGDPKCDSTCSNTDKQIIAS